MKSLFKFSPQAWGELEGGILTDLRQPPPNLPQVWGRNNSILQEAPYLRKETPKNVFMIESIKRKQYDRYGRQDFGEGGETSAGRR